MAIKFERFVLAQMAVLAAAVHSFPNMLVSFSPLATIHGGWS
jgi:hypothetical protein